MVTIVNNITGVESVNQGYQWNEQTALRLFYKFITPQIKDEEQRAVKRSLRSWLLDADEWADTEWGKIDFSLEDFNRINKSALSELEQSTLGELASNPMGEKNTKFGATESFGFKLQQDTGSRLEGDDINLGRITNWQKAKSVLSEKINEAKQNKDISDAARNRRVNKLESEIADINELMEELKKPAFNDNITLSSVVESPNEGELFYSYRPINPELASEAAIALGEAKDFEEIHYKDDPKQFFLDWNIEYKDYREAIVESQKELGHIQRISNPAYTELVESKGTNLFEGVQKKYFKMMYDKIPSLKVDFTSFEAFKENLQELSSGDAGDWEAYFSKLSKEYESEVGRPLQKPASFSRKLDSRQKRGKDEFLPYGAKLTLDEINFALSNFEDTLLAQPVQDKSRQTSGSKVKQRVGEQFVLNISYIDKGSAPALSFEEMYSEKIGMTKMGASEIRQMKNPMRGKLTFDKVMPMTDKIKEIIPKITADEIYKTLRNALTQYTRRTSTGTEENLENKLSAVWLKPLHTRLTYGLETIHDLADILNKERKSKELIDIDSYDDSYWYTNDSNKRNRVEWINYVLKLASEGKAEQNIMNQFTGLSEALNNLRIYHTWFEKDFDDEDDQTDDKFKDMSLVNMKEYAKANNIDVAGLKTEGEFRNALDSATSSKKIREDEVQESIVDDDDDSAQFDEDDEEIQEEGLKEDSELYQFLQNLDNQELKIYIDSINTLRANIETLLKSKSYKLNNTNMVKAVQQFFQLTDFDNAFSNQLDRLQKLGIHSSRQILDEFQNTDSINENTHAIITAFKDDLAEFWEVKGKEMREPEPEDFNKLMEYLEFKEELAKLVQKDNSLNNIINAGVEMNNDNLKILLDFVDKSVTLKGKINWIVTKQYKAYSRITGDKGEGVTPKVYSGGLPDSERERIKLLIGKKVSASGEVVLREGELVNNDRYTFLTKVRTNFINLKRAVNE